MPISVRFYRDLLGMEIIYGSEDAYFSSLRTKQGRDPILNLAQGNPVTQWGRLIFHVPDVDKFWGYLKERGYVRRHRETLHGANDISTCPIQMATSCRSRIRSGDSSGKSPRHHGLQFRRAERRIGRSAKS
jgi:catechol 2,3-dioxygenase-like lactoylglutathione lyase family enzyme